MKYIDLTAFCYTKNITATANEHIAA